MPLDFADIVSGVRPSFVAMDQYSVMIKLQILLKFGSYKNGGSKEEKSIG